MSDGATFIDNYQRVLGDPGVREGNQWIFYCPFPGCAASRKRKFRVNVQNGAWQCKRCCEVVPGKVYRPETTEPHGGGWRDFVRMMGDESHWHLWSNASQHVMPAPPRLPLPEARALWTDLFAKCVLLPADREKLGRRGINPDEAGFVSASAAAFGYLQEERGGAALVQAGIAYQTDDGAVRPNRCVQPGRVLIPYRQGEQVNHFVGYCRCPERRRGQDPGEYQRLKDNWPPYAGPAQFPTRIYGRVERRRPFLIVTEGQIKALAAIQRGFPSVGLQGMGNNHPELADLCQEQGVWHVVIAFDSQLEQEEVEYQELRLARELLKRGVQPYRLRFPLDPGIDGGKKMDQDSYLLHYPNQAFIALIRQARARPFRWA